MFGSRTLNLVLTLARAQVLPNPGQVGETEAARGLGHTIRWFDGHEEGLVEWEEALHHAHRVGDHQVP